MKRLIVAGILATAVCAFAQTSPPAEKASPQLPPLPDPFPGVIDSAMPLTPDQIRTLRKRQDSLKRAAADPARTPPKPRIRSITADLSPGSTPVAVRLAAGFSSGIAFMDASGAPWPVAALHLAAKEDFAASLLVPGTNVVTLNAMAEYSQSNLLVFLKDMSTPVTIAMFAGQSDIDYRLDVRIPSRGPNAMPEPVPVDMNIKFNARLSEVLDGIPPSGTKPVTVNGAAGMAWRDGNRLLIRTTSSIMSPAPIQMTSSQDGMRAYELDYTPSVLVSQDGRLVTLRISE